MPVRLRAANRDDAEAIALLHADSWRRNYRGVYADSFLDGDVVSDRRSVWSTRLRDPGNSATVVAEDELGLTGFVHVVFDDDVRWGSLVDNLHVSHERRRTGIGTALLGHAARAVLDRSTGKSIYLWVQEANLQAQSFYRQMGGIRVELAPVSPPGGVPARLCGSPNKLRINWPDASLVGRTTGS